MVSFFSLIKLAGNPVTLVMGWIGLRRLLKEPILFGCISDWQYTFQLLLYSCSPWYSCNNLRTRGGYPSIVTA